MKELLNLVIQNIENFELSAQFRKGQKPFYDAIIKSLKKDKTTMFVKGPTGMGKTFLEAVLAAALIGNSDIKILLLTSKITLLQQIQREFKRFVGFLKTGLFGGGFKNYHEQVTIMTYASYQRQSESFIKQFKVLLLDEGHKGLGKKTKEQLEKQKEFSILIGFTASDEYSKEKSLTKFLVNKAHELSIKEAVEIGMLSNIKVMIASVDIEIDSQQKGESKVDYEERISSEIIREGGNIATARLYKRVFEKRNLRGIALVLTTLQGRDLVEECAKEGIKAELIHSGLKRDEREEMFTRFRNHEFSLLIGMGIIKEGFDDPGVSVAITTYPVSSIVDMTQFPGRAERIDEQNPDKVAYIVNLAYKAKKQLFYSDVLNGKSELRQKKKRTKKLDMISSSEMQEAIARKPDSYITNVAVSEEEVMELMRNVRGLELYSQEEILVKAKIELSIHNIKDRFSLINTGSHSLRNLDFGMFGSGTSLAKKVLLDKSFKHVTHEVLKQVADRLGWDNQSLLEQAKLELKKNGITDRVSLFNMGTTNFNQLNFNTFGKGHYFIKLFFPDIVFKYVTHEVLKQVADRLGWDNQSLLEQAKLELKKHGITDRVSLLRTGQQEFRTLKFGPFGKSTVFTRSILGNDFRKISTETLEKIAEKFDWQKIKTITLAFSELKKHGITNRVSLFQFGVKKFSKSNFGLFGKGVAFAGWLLPEVRINGLDSSIFEKIAEKLEWSDFLNVDLVKLELKKHGIIDKMSLLKIGSAKFSKLKFGPFKGARSLAKWLIPEDDFRSISTKDLEKIALALDW